MSRTSCSKDPSSEGKVYVVDHDPNFARSLESLINSIGLDSQSFFSAHEFLNYADFDRPCCGLIDVQLPGMSGLELQRELLKRGLNIPLILYSSNADVPMAVEAMRHGALGFLEKPFPTQHVCDEIQRAMFMAEGEFHQRQQQLQARRKIALLNDKEREVLQRVTEGYTNREIADQLNLSIRAIEERRSRVMQKLKVETLSELIGVVNRAL